jgi:hypothetical protein
MRQMRPMISSAILVQAKGRVLAFSREREERGGWKRSR